MELNRGGTAEEVIREGDPKDMIDIDNIVTLNRIARGPNLNYFELCPAATLTSRKPISDVIYRIPNLERHLCWIHGCYY